MLFHTLTFCVFLALTVIALAIVRRHHARQKVVLLVASTVFYMWWNPAFILLILATASIDYAIALAMSQRGRSETQRASLLAVSVTSNLALLAFFKYSHFLEQNLLLAMRAVGYAPNWADVNIVLPVGISFYTFNTMSYTVDVYRRRIAATRSALDYAVFVTFFPHLVAGPIVRASDFLWQLERPARLTFDREALFLFLRGLTKKVVIADGVALLADGVFSDPARWPSVVIWMGALAFYVQIYCDFSGYTDMAIAIARLLGYQLPKNFDRPYFSTSTTEFWRRWHITLSSWLRDYLYIPLGGNRRGRVIGARNLLITMIVGGLWHGASWSFALWGALHGVALIAHRAWRRTRRRLGVPPALDRNVAYGVIAWCATQYWILLTWIPFRVTDSRAMRTALEKFVLFDRGASVMNIGLGALWPISTMALIAAFLALHAWSAWHGGLDERLARASPLTAALACALIGAVLLLLWPAAQAPFIYFQF